MPFNSSVIIKNIEDLDNAYQEDLGINKLITFPDGHTGAILCRMRPTYL